MESAGVAPGVVVIGAGHAGAETVAALRARKYAGAVTLVGDEQAHPYMRPPLSKAFLADELPLERILVRPTAFFERFDVRLVLGTTVASIDRAGRRVGLADGSDLPYSTLVIATGGLPRRLSSLEAPNVHYLRTKEDAGRLRPELQPGSRLVIVGGGYVGLEVAALARERGLEVAVIEAEDRLLSRVAGPELAGFVHDWHVDRGIRVWLGAAVGSFETGPVGRVTGVVLRDGRTITADLVLVSIGLVPNERLAAESMLEVADGVVVDEYCRTSDPEIYAVGDCTRHPCYEVGGTRRLESVPNATEQARTVAAAICGEDLPYRAVPWFWSDQGDLKLKSVGLAAGCDTVVLRPQREPTQFAAFYLNGGQIRAADIVNNPKLFAISKRLVGSRAAATAEQLADPELSIEALLASVGGS